MSQEERFYYLAFSAFEEGIGPMRFLRILQKFGSAKTGFYASEQEILQILPSNVVQRFLRFRRCFDLERYIKSMVEKGISFVTIQDDEYPFLLKQIPDPPYVLYVKGEFDKKFWWKSNDKISVVGTRIPTSYGKEVTGILTEELAKNGLTIVSGMALGVDTIAHQTAIGCQAKTIAVLGCGVDVVYPSENKKLYEEIARGNGCIVSEMPIGHFATRSTFPARNRIISGLSQGVLMTEGKINSGALITCSYAAIQGRGVFAVPGQINSELAGGVLSLITKGAHPVVSAKDILDELKTDDIEVKKEKRPDLKGDEKMIFNLLESSELTIDDMIRKTGFDAQKISGILSFWEIEGLIENKGGKYKINF